VAGTGTATRVLNWNNGTISNYDSTTNLTIGSGIAIRLAATGTHAFDIGTGRSATVDSDLGNLTTNGTLTKTGLGTLVLNGTNTYSGTTTVSSGTLLVNGSLGATAVTVDSGATLGGTGSIGGNVIINGLLSTGNSPGSLTLGSTNLTFGSGGSALFELGGTTRGDGSSNYDSILGINALTLDGIWTVSLINGFTPAENDFFDLFDATTVNSSGFNVGTDLLLPTLSGGLAWDTSTFASTGILTVVPEPGVALLGGLGVLALLRRRR
jgi:autotransporter-associated beta strand protein